jgi:hypothetical protein
MANDNKVTKDLTRSKEIFLREPPGFHTGPPKLYSVEDEFHKTAANKSPVVTLVVLAFLVVFAAVAIGVTYFINRASQDVPIGISEFQDINLTDILDGQKRNQTTMRAAQLELEDLQGQQRDKIQAVQDDASKNIEYTSNQNIAQAERDRRNRAFRADAQTLVAKIQAEYGPRIEAKKKEIAALQTQIDAYDSRMIDQAKKSEQLLNSQRQLFDAQRDQLTKYYEDKLAEAEKTRQTERQDLIAQKNNMVALLNKNHADEIARLTARWNPTYTEQPVLAALGRSVSAPAGDIAQLPPFRPVLASEGIWTDVRLAATRGYLDDLRVVLKRLQDTPYINSVPGALKKIEALERVIVSDYETLWVALASVVEKKNGMIADRDATIRTRDATIRDRDATISQLDTAVDQFAFALDAQTRSSRENGYVLDPRNTGRITVYLNSAIPVREGMSGYVLRQENDPVATVQFHLDGGTITARLVSLSTPGKPIEPFDKILVQLK